MDHEHIRYIYTHGFDAFWKGDTMRERMLVNVDFGVYHSSRTTLGSVFLAPEYSTVMTR